MRPTGGPELSLRAHRDSHLMKQTRSQLRCAAAVGLYSALASAQGFQPSFTRVDLDLGQSLTAVALGDLDRDGRSDLIASSIGSLRVRLSDGVGGFGAVVDVSQGSLWVEDLAVGDVNGDGFADVVGIDRPAEMLAVHLGDGNGGLAPALAVPVGVSLQPFAIAIALGDFDGDGLDDVALSGAQQDGAIVKLASGAGSFGPAVVYGTFDSPTSVEVGDIDGDGKLDLVLPGGGGLAVLIGDGAGGFTAAVLTGPAASTSRAALADFDGDGRTDVCVTASSSLGAWVLRSTGGGVLAVQATLSLPNLAADVAIADFSRDGHLDLAVGVYGTAGVRTFTGGANPFQFTASSVQSSVTPAFRVVGGDFERDVAPDLVVIPNTVGGGLSVLFNQTPASTAGMSFCVAKLNSQGCLPTLTGIGVSSVSSVSGFTVSATQVLNQRAGLFLYGTNGPAAAAFQGGTMCVRLPVRRTAQQNSGGSSAAVNDCSGSIALDFNAFSAGLAGGAPAPELAMIGTEVACQAWSRDSVAVASSSLSNGFVFSVGP